MVSSIYCAWLKEGVTILILGQGDPSGMVASKDWLVPVHGQPDLLTPVSGSSVNRGKFNFSFKKTL